MSNQQKSLVLGQVRASAERAQQLAILRESGHKTYPSVQDKDDSKIVVPLSLDAEYARELKVLRSWIEDL